jgi:hypothetical protein
MKMDRTVGRIGLATKVRLRRPHAGGEVMFNSDLIFLAGVPIVVLEWEQRSFGDYPAVTVTLDPMYLHKTDWSDAEYLYELSIEDPRGSTAFGSNIVSERLQIREQSSEPMPDDVRQAFRDAICLYADSKFGNPMRPVNFRKLQKISISGVCDLVLGYRNEPLPAGVHHELLNLIDELGIHPKVALTEDSSYAAGAQYLLNLIDDQKQIQPAAKKKAVW